MNSLRGKKKSYIGIVPCEKMEAIQKNTKLCPVKKMKRNIQSMTSNHLVNNMQVLALKKAFCASTPNLHKV